MIKKPVFDELILQRFHAYASAVISEKAFDLGEVDLVAQHTIQGLVVTLRTYIWGEKIEAKKVEYPQDWWEALKERFAPEWVLKRWPVKKQVHWFDVWKLYPKFKVAERLGPSVHIPIFHQDENWWRKPEDLE